MIVYKARLAEDLVRLELLPQSHRPVGHASGALKTTPSLKLLDHAVLGVCILVLYGMIV